MKPALVVLAAGLGSRYGGIKQMEGFGPNGEWLLEYSVYDAIKAGFGHMVFVLRQEILAEFSAYFDQRLPSDIKRDYVIQDISQVPEGFDVPENRTKPWGTGHAVFAAKDVVDTPFAVINADDFYGAESFYRIADFLNQVDPRSFDFAMSGYLLKNTLSDNGSVARGVCKIDENGYLQQVEEHTQIERIPGNGIINTGLGSHKELDEDTIVSMNFWGFTPLIFKEINRQFKDFLRKNEDNIKAEFYIPSVVQELMNEGLATVQVEISNQQWFGVTYVDDTKEVKEELKKLQENGTYPSPLWDSIV